jgi:Zn-dependent protease with chaperone function
MITPQDFIHPQDEAARRNMEAIPGFAAAVKSFLKIGLEQYYHGINMASKIRLSQKQLPDLYRKLPPICERLSIAVPEFFLEMNPAPNAYTFGDTRVFMTITSGLVEYCAGEEVDAVIAHECGHIACHHVLYHTMADLMKAGADMFGLLGVLTKPIQLALFYWSRRSEFSADRAAAAATGSAKPVIDTMIRLSGGSKAITGEVNVEEYAAQAEAYDHLQESKWDKFLQTTAIATASHPFTSVRVREIMKWCEGEQFHRLIENLKLARTGKQCLHCHQPVEENWKFCKSCGTQL